MAVARQKHLQQKEVLTLRRWSDLAPNASSGWNSVRLALRLVAKCSIFCRGTNTWWNPIPWSPEKLQCVQHPNRFCTILYLNLDFHFAALLETKRAPETDGPPVLQQTINLLGYDPCGPTSLGRYCETELRVCLVGEKNLDFGTVVYFVVI